MDNYLKIKRLVRKNELRQHQNRLSLLDRRHFTSQTGSFISIQEVLNLLELTSTMIAPREFSLPGAVPFEVTVKVFFDATEPSL